MNRRCAPESESWCPHAPRRPRGIRTRLPARRALSAHRVRIGGNTVHVSFDLYPDGQPGALNIEMHKSGAVLRLFGMALGHVVSLALQYGVPVQTIAESLTGLAGGPSGDVSGHDSPTPIRRAVSIVDMIAQMMAVEFLGKPIVRKDPLT